MSEVSNTERERPRPFRQFADFILWSAVAAVAVYFTWGEGWWFILGAAMVFVAWDEFTNWLDEIDKARYWPYGDR